MEPRRIVGIDPGRAKAGYAVVESGGNVLEAGIASLDELVERLRPAIERYAVEGFALGRGTNAAAIAKLLAPLGLSVHLVDEYETTRFARELYFADHPPRGWRRLVPLGLQTPARPIDDYAAILIARRYWGAKGDPPARA